ncbi:MAG: hypothetical protein AAGN15_01815 [Cyanobacteria bacterium J06581_3]
MKIRKSFRVFTVLTLLACGLILPVGAQQAAEEAEMEALLRQLEAQEAEWQQLDRQMEGFREEMRAFEAELEASGMADAMDRYHSHLATCSPVTLIDFPFPGATETIRGWEGDRCRIDTQMTFGDESIVSSCLYTQQDIALIVGPELYLPEDLERTCQS